MSQQIDRWVAERIAARAGLPLTGALEGCLIPLIQSAREGHLCIPIENSASLPPTLWSRGEDPAKPLVIDQQRLYLQRNWALETKIIEGVVRLRARAVSGYDEPAYREGLQQIQSSLQSAQYEALQAAWSESFSIFTGGPGTGKTYTAGCYIRLLSKARLGRMKAIVTAPTGKAAAHLQGALRTQGGLPESLQLEAATLHALVRLIPGKQRLDSERTIDADLVVVDEASMLDLSLLLHLLNGIGPHTRLLLLGDPDQLPPVESGSLFTELSELFGHRLHRSIRMGDGDLYALSQAMNRGDRSAALSLFEKSSELTRVSTDFSLQSREKLIDFLCEKLPSPLFDQEPDPKICLANMSKFRILCGLRQGLLGTEELNRLLSERWQRGYRWSAIPILISKNDLRLNLFNGTSGVLIRKGGARTGAAYFSSPGGIQSVAEGALPSYEEGFCLSVHKSQGSEFEEVLALFPPGSERFGREVLYTAVTRAKKTLTLLIDDETLASVLATPSRRKSGLLERLGGKAVVNSFHAGSSN